MDRERGECTLHFAGVGGVGIKVLTKYTTRAVFSKLSY